MDVIKLLKTKNRCLQRVLDLSRSFLEMNDLNTLDKFQTERAAIFKAIELYERKIMDTLAALPETVKDPEITQRVTQILEEKDQLIHEILTLDNELMLRIENKKQKILEELAASRKSHELAGKFKSNWVAAGGEELDKTL